MRACDLSHQLTVMRLGSQDYFRDVTREDLLELLPAFPDPAVDPAFLVPPLGRPLDAPPLEGGGFGSAPEASAGRNNLQVSQTSMHASYYFSFGLL